MAKFEISISTRISVWWPSVSDAQLLNVPCINTVRVSRPASNESSNQPSGPQSRVAAWWRVTPTSSCLNSYEHVLKQPGRQVIRPLLDRGGIYRGRFIVKPVLCTRVLGTIHE
jgi:hypothetical protein